MRNGRAIGRKNARRRNLCQYLALTPCLSLSVLSLSPAFPPMWTDGSKMTGEKSHKGPAEVILEARRMDVGSVPTLSAASLLTCRNRRAQNNLALLTHKHALVSLKRSAIVSVQQPVWAIMELLAPKSIAHRNISVRSTQPPHDMVYVPV